MMDFDEPRVYKIAKNRLIYSVGAIFVIVIASFLEGEKFSIGWFIFLGLLILYLFIPFVYKLIVSNDAISSLDLFRTQTLEWSEIAEVRPKSGGIILVNPDNSIKVIVKSQIDDYPEVIRFISQKRSDLLNSQNLTEFHQGILENILLFILGLGLVFFMIQFIISGSISTGTIIASLFGLTIATFMIWSGLSKIRKVFIDGEILIIYYLFWKQEYHVTEIQSAVLEQKMEKNQIKYPVFVRLKNGKQIVIEKVKEGNPILLNALERWLEIYQRSVSPSANSLENL